MAKYIFIGGGDIGRGDTQYETANIDREIVKMSGKEKPNLLFIGLASKFSDSYYDTVKNIYKDLGCNCSYLKKKNILNNPDIVKNKINNADIIYVGGGDTVKLVSELKKFGIDNLLRNVGDDVVIAGISAGAIMISDKGFSDSLILRGESENYEFIEGLGLCSYIFCPHYNLERKEELCKRLKNSADKILCLEDRVALFFDNGIIKIIRSDESKKAFYCYYENNRFIEQEII